MDPFVTASLITGGASLLGQAFGSSSSPGGWGVQKTLDYDKIVNRRSMVMDKTTRRRNRKLTAANYKNYGSKVAQVRDAKRAGLHPLFAMGATGNQAISAGPAGPSANSTSGNAPTGQSDNGSFLSKGLKEASKHYERIAEVEASKELILAQAQASALRIAENNTSNDVQVVSNQESKINPQLQEFKKGEVQAHKPGTPTENMNVISPVTSVNLGSQVILSPVEETDSFFEDPVALGIATYFYKGNQHVNWSQVLNEWTGRKPTAKETTTGTRDMFKRLGLQMRKPNHRRYRRRVKGKVATTR